MHHLGKLLDGDGLVEMLLDIAADVGDHVIVCHVACFGLLGGAYHNRKDGGDDMGETGVFFYRILIP